MEMIRGTEKTPIQVLKNGNVSSLYSLFTDVLADLKLSKKSLKKGENAVINVLYICILDLLKTKLEPEDFKYHTRFEFMLTYGEVFHEETDKEKYLLWQSANWMNILFKLCRAKTNLGLTIEVISKFLEGWDGNSFFFFFYFCFIIFFFIIFFLLLAKYITGGGMSAATTRRVYLYREEGNVPIVHRLPRLPKHLQTKKEYPPLKKMKQESDARICPHCGTIH